MNKHSHHAERVDADAHRSIDLSFSVIVLPPVQRLDLSDLLGQWMCTGPENFDNPLLFACFPSLAPGVHAVA